MLGASGHSVRQVIFGIDPTRGTYNHSFLLGSLGLHVYGVKEPKHSSYVKTRNDQVWRSSGKLCSDLRLVVYCAVALWVLIQRRLFGELPLAPAPQLVKLPRCQVARPSAEPTLRAQSPPKARESKQDLLFGLLQGSFKVGSGSVLLTLIILK